MAEDGSFNIDKTKINDIIIAEKNKENENVLQNNTMVDLDCEEFNDFTPNGWEKFYSKDERFFKFPKEGIIHDQIIIHDQMYKYKK